MKRILIAAALGSTICTIPAQAFDGTIYGNFRGSLNMGDFGTEDSNVEFVNNASRVGIKGASKKSESGLQGIYHIQMGAQNDDGPEGKKKIGEALTSRFYFAGLKGSFGKAIYGRLSTPYKMAGLKQDLFYDTSAGPYNGGSNYGYSSLNNGFTNNSLAYYSPKFAGGLTFNATASVDDTAEDDHDWGIGVQYATKMFKVGASHLQLDKTPVIAADDGAENATRIYGSVFIDQITISASYESVDFAGNSDSTSFYHVNGSYQFNPQIKFAASYGKVAEGISSKAWNATGDGFTLGAFYDVLPATTLTLIYTAVDYDDSAITDRDGLVFGVIQKF
jgi:hypothetical protein